jgi:hypothetical protein
MRATRRNNGGIAPRPLLHPGQFRRGGAHSPSHPRRSQGFAASRASEPGTPSQTHRTRCQFNDRNSCADARQGKRSPSRRPQEAGAGDPSRTRLVARRAPRRRTARRACEHRPMSVVELWRRGQAGWPRRFPLVQAPNPPLLVAFAGRWIAAACGPAGRVHSIGRVVFTLGLGAWAWDETTRGANWFRRVLGVVGLAWVVAERRRVLGARWRPWTGTRLRPLAGARASEMSQTPRAPHRRRPRSADR